MRRAPGLQVEPTLDRLWDVNDTANFLRVSRSWVYQEAAAGALPSIRLGGLLRFHPNAIKGHVGLNVPPQGEAPPQARPVKQQQAAQSPVPEQELRPQAQLAAEQQHRRVLLPEDFLSVREAAHRLRVSRATVYKLCETGQLPHRRVANAIRIKPEDSALLAAMRRSPR